MITMFYITFIVMCPNKPDIPIFMRTANLEAASVAYYELRHREYHIHEKSGCRVNNVRLQSENLTRIEK